MKKPKAPKRTNVSRREFFKSAGAGIVASELAAARPAEGARGGGINCRLTIVD
jgi:hypothetical protein